MKVSIPGLKETEGLRSAAFGSLKVAKSTDIPSIMLMAENFIKSSPYKDVSIDTNKIYTVINNLMSSPHGLVLLYTIDDKPVGMLGAKVEQLYFSDETISLEVVWWVEPEHRKSKVGLELMDAYEYWATNVQKVNIVQMSLLGEDERLKELYKRRGYDLSEQTFTKRIYYTWQ